MLLVCFCGLVNGVFFVFGEVVFEEFVFDFYL